MVLKKKNNIIDFTSDQFDFKIPYENARRASFFKGKIKTNNGFISKRGFKMAQVLELI